MNIFEVKDGCPTIKGKTESQVQNVGVNSLSL